MLCCLSCHTSLVALCEQAHPALTLCVVWTEWFPDSARAQSVWGHSSRALSAYLCRCLLQRLFCLSAALCQPPNTDTEESVYALFTAVSKGVLEQGLL